MVQSKATTAGQYLDELPEPRRAVVSAVREAILRNLPPGFVESVRWGMLSYEVPLESYPKTYNGQPLGYAALAAQKNYFVLYLTNVYYDADGERTLQEKFRQAGKTLDIGKSCVRFRKLDDLPLNVIGEVIAGTTPEAFIARYEANRKK
jgi:hypothetical protein